MRYSFAGVGDFENSGVFDELKKRPQVVELKRINDVIAVGRGDLNETQQGEKTFFSDEFRIEAHPFTLAVSAA